MSFWEDVRNSTEGMFAGTAIGGLVAGPMGASFGAPIGAWLGNPGDWFGGGGNDAEGFTFYNPGQIDLSQQNPELWKEIQRTQAERGAFHDANRYAFEDGFWDQRANRMMDQAQTRTQNRFANIGLGGSSMALGAAEEAGQQTLLGLQDRRMSEQMRAMQMDQMLSGNIQHNILAGQQQFAGYQQQMLNAYMGKEAQDAANTNSIIAAGGTVAGTVAGAYLGGPSGAALGAGLGSRLSAGQANANVDTMMMGMPSSDNFSLGGGMNGGPSLFGDSNPAAYSGYGYPTGYHL